ILDHYRDIIGLRESTILERYEHWRPSGDSEPNQWQFAGSRDDWRKELWSLYHGKIQSRVPFGRLERLLSAFDDPLDTKDVPELTAQWLTVDRTNIPCVHLTFDKFFSPPTAEHGIRSVYLNAPTRLEGFECAFVRLTLEPNNAQSQLADGTVVNLDRV